MEETFKNISGWIALGIEAVGIIIIAGGCLLATVRLIVEVVRGAAPRGWRGKIFYNLGVWLMLGLLFLLGADIVRSAIAPTWENIGHLAAIAVIRTFLNYFLERDLDRVAEAKKSSAEPSDVKQGEAI